MLFFYFLFGINYSYPGDDFFKWYIFTSISDFYITCNRLEFELCRFTVKRVVAKNSFCQFIIIMTGKR